LSADARVAVGLAVAGAGYYAATLGTFPLGFGDEGYLYYVAWAHRQGRAFYDQIVLHSYLPGLFVPFARLFEVVGPSIVAARALMAAGLTLTPVLLYLAARRLVGRGLALAAAVVVLLVPGPWPNFYIGTLATGTLCAGIALVGDGRARAAAALGVVVGIAWWLRIDAAIAGVGLMGVAIGLRRWAADARETLVVPAVLGMAAGFAPGFLMLVSRGALAGYGAQVAGFPLAILGRSTGGENLPPPALAQLARLDAAGAEAWLFYGSFVLVGALVALAARRLPRARGAARVEAAALAFAAVWVLTNVPQYAFERPDLPHLARRTSALALALAAVARAGWTTWRPLAVLPAAYLVLLLGVLGVRYPGAGGSWSPQPIAWRRAASGVDYPTTASSWTARLVELVERETAPGDLVAVWPYLPGLSFVTGRLTPGRYPMVFPDVMTPAIEDELLDDLRRDRVGHLVYLPAQRMHQSDASAPAGFMPRVDAVVRRDYAVSAEVAGVELRRRTAPFPASRVTMPGSSPSR